MAWGVVAIILKANLIVWAPTASASACNVDGARMVSHYNSNFPGLRFRWGCYSIKEMKNHRTFNGQKKMTFEDALQEMVFDTLKEGSNNENQSR
jgi:hypothetical protein